MKKTNRLGFQILTKTQCQNIFAGADSGGTNSGGPKSGGTSAGGSVGNDECQLMYLNPPPPVGTPEYQIYLACLYNFPPPVNGNGITPP